MTITAVLLLILIGFCAGAFGALAGVGGGIIVTPLLAIYFGLPMHQAIGVTLLCVIGHDDAGGSASAGGDRILWGGIWRARRSRRRNHRYAAAGHLFWIANAPSHWRDAALRDRHLYRDFFNVRGAPRY